jgi:oxygen-independent coproporphyrinogen-3 oxidase
MSSISHYGTCYAQNEKTLPEYYAAIRAGGLATRVGYNMSFDDQVRKFVIMGLMCRPYLDVTEVEEKFGITFREYFAEALLKLGPLADDGLVVDGGSRIYVTGDGRLFLRNIAICFDAHTDMAKRRQQLYSRTV